MPFIGGYDFNTLPEIKKKVRDSTVSSLCVNENNNNNNINPFKPKNDDALKPANNVFELSDGQPDTGPIKKPAFTIEIELEEKAISELMN